MRLSKKVKQMVETVDTRSLRNNAQRVLVALLRQEGEWVSRKSLRVPSATARIRDLRKSNHGSWTVEVASARKLGRRGTSHDTFYRLAPSSITSERVAFTLRGE